jgi:hypothetical protein
MNDPALARPGRGRHGRSMRVPPLLLMVLAMPAPAAARDALGIYGNWGAFRDADAGRCYAIAEPRQPSAGGWRAFASVATWPARGVRGQLHVRLSRARRSDAPVVASIGEHRVMLVAGSADAWTPDPRADAALVAAMRSGETLLVTARDTAGRRIADAYALKGAATAIDAAALACARR